MENVRFLPMPVPHPVWNDEDNGYPGALKVSFTNGKVRTYRIDPVQQPAPQVISTAELTRIFQRNTYGYYKGKHEKK